MHKHLSMILGVVSAAALCWMASRVIEPGVLRTMAYLFAVLFGLGAGRVFAGGGKTDMRPLLVSCTAAAVGCYLVAHLLPMGLPSYAGYAVVLLSSFGAGTGVTKFFPG